MEEGKRDKAVDLAVSQIERQYGRGAIMKLGGDVSLPDVRTISTGSLALDMALGVGGLPRGRVVEIYGHAAVIQSNTSKRLHISPIDVGKSP